MHGKRGCSHFVEYPIYRRPGRIEKPFLAFQKHASKIGQIPNVCKVSQQIGHPKRNPGKYATCQNLSFVPGRKRLLRRPLPHGCFLNLYGDYS